MEVFIFGAGASKHLDGPLNDELLKEGLNLLLFPGVYDLPEQSYKDVAQLVDTLFGTTLVKDIEGKHYFDETLIKGINAEELLAFVDMAVEKGDNWLPFDRLRRALLEFIFVTIEKAMEVQHSDSIKSNPDGTIDHRRNLYDRLVDYIIDPRKAYSFLSFNYDLFLDKASCINNHRLVPDYHLEFDEIIHFPGYQAMLDGKRKDVLHLLKLHGSQNWARCPSCKKFRVFFYSQFKRILNETCSLCGSTYLEPVLVPPTYRKRIEDLGLKSVWDFAMQSLENANSLTVIGYSFPDTDIEAKWAIKSSLLKNSKNPKLTLVNKTEETRLRIAKFLGYTQSGDVQHYDTFDSYCKAMQKQ